MLQRRTAVYVFFVKKLPSYRLVLLTALFNLLF
jgi:hypothetical protein